MATIDDADDRRTCRTGSALGHVVKAALPPIATFLRSFRWGRIVSVIRYGIDWVSRELLLRGLAGWNRDPADCANPRP